MKKCTKCKTDKPESEFYKSKITSSGLQAWCKECVKARSKNNASLGYVRIKAGSHAESTQLVRQMLAERGIPSCIGSSMEMMKVDLLAWACVPIEAKIARESAPNKFIWTFTKNQFAKLQGFVVCIADFGDNRRTLVIPVSEIKYSAKEKAARRGSLCITFDSFDVRSLWPALMKYEDRFDLIDAARVEWASKLGDK